MVKKVVSFSVGFISGFISLAIVSILVLSGSSFGIGAIIFGLLFFAGKSFSKK